MRISWGFWETMVVGLVVAATLGFVLTLVSRVLDRLSAKRKEERP